MPKIVLPRNPVSVSIQFLTIILAQSFEFLPARPSRRPFSLSPPRRQNVLTHSHCQSPQNYRTHCNVTSCIIRLLYYTRLDSICRLLALCQTRCQPFDIYIIPFHPWTTRRHLYYQHLCVTSEGLSGFLSRAACESGGVLSCRWGPSAPTGLDLLLSGPLPLSCTRFPSSGSDAHRLDHQLLPSSLLRTGLGQKYFQAWPLHTGGWGR